MGKIWRERKKPCRRHCPRGRFCVCLTVRYGGSRAKGLQGVGRFLAEIFEVHPGHLILPVLIFLSGAEDPCSPGYTLPNNSPRRALLRGQYIISNILSCLLLSLVLSFIGWTPPKSNTGDINDVFVFLHNFVVREFENVAIEDI